MSKVKENKETCRMIIFEDGDLVTLWECSACLTHFNPTKKFEASKRCPSCCASIIEWIGFDDEIPE